MFHLQAPRRPPFSDWLAQVERICLRHDTGHIASSAVNLLRAYYDNGISAQEAADDLIGG